MIIDFRNRSMKSEPPGSGRQPSGPVPGACDMSKALRNGDRSEAVLRQVSLVAAFHDHISCAKSAELLEPMPCESDHLYAHCGDDAPDDTEQDRLRAIVVLHTDLIQHQQELIAERDRQIDELRVQRDELQERLRRLQACVAHVACQTEEALLNVAAPAPLLAELLRPVPEPQSSPADSSYEPIAEVAPCESEEAPAEREEEQPVASEQRRHAQVPKAAEPCDDLEQRPPAGRPAAEPARTESVQQQAEAAPPPRGPPPAAEDEERAQEAPAEVPAAPVQSSSQEAAAPPESPARKAARKRSAATRDDAGPVLWSDRTYSTCLPPPPPEEPIEVPTWRVNHITSLYSMEGTENLDDEVFRKRHAKLEANEKRRKRWDLQLLREQQHTERLRRRMERSVERPPSCPPSFCGDLKHIGYIEVVESLPVVAFGQPIPELQPAEFSLPWVKHSSRHGESSTAGERMAAKKQRKNMQPKGPWR
ncbi:uncharacterized protein [Dermacentor andersoni]|uniref:uncharacterized protein isoform X1 n=1 Tax=Dermacentor andersoni TaxID=34620 RepID=UPI00215551CB|nr:male-specific lethal 1 homolog isoform X1 [Dermacentor andersoni]